MRKTKLYNFMVSEENIFRAIYALESFVFEPTLLSQTDLALFYQLHDKLNHTLVQDVMAQVKSRIEDVLINDELFSLKVYFKPKKLDTDTGEIESRPLHTASLVDQIAMVAMLNSLLFDVNDNKMTLNQLALSLPPNFYGNIPSEDPKHLFVPWRKKYKEYSENVTQAYERFIATEEYSHEVSLDLVQFFPSLNPLLVYDWIISKHGARYAGAELESFKLVLFKLLCTRIEDVGTLNHCYYGEHIPQGSAFVRGIPQGLPQAYFFGNIAMILVAAIFDNLFKGVSYYYVDDSVIFCNHPGKDFSLVVDQINLKLAELSQMEQFDSRILPESGWSKSFYEYCTPNSFCLKVHEEGSKSSIMEIGMEGLGLAYLAAIGREASMGAFEVRTRFSEDEDWTVLNKLRVIRESLEAEIARVDRLPEEQRKDNYRKYLVRFRKFFKFRERLVEYDEEPKTDLEDLFETLCDKKGEFIPGKIEQFFDVYNEDIFLTELLFRLRNNADPLEYDKVMIFVTSFDRAVYGTNQGTYLTQVIGSFEVEMDFCSVKERAYQSVARYVTRNVPKHNNTSYDSRIKAFQALIKDFLDDSGGSGPYGDFILERPYTCLVDSSTGDLRRRIINAFVSRVLNVEISDDIPVYRLDKRSLSLNEYRILLYIRNPRCNIPDFLRFVKTEVVYSSSKTVDVAVTEVVNHFLTYVGAPELIDNLLLVHDYTTAVWKNGSKHLHFYTLHNQEHAMKLIKASVKITKAIRHFSLSKRDYYILFLACYLHDISMALHPDLNLVFSDSNPKSDLVASKFKREVAKSFGDFDTAKSRDLKKLLLKYYKEMDLFFENHVRGSHHEDSAEFMRTTSHVAFLDGQIRDLVSEVSSAHGFSPTEVYGARSKADSFTINKKYVSAVLRLADLLDMADDRISKPILDHSNMYMHEVTHFHWLSHHAISGYGLKSEYSNSALSQKSDSSYLKHGNFKEKVVLTINLNAWQEEFVECDVCDYKVLEERDAKSYILKIGSQKEKCAEQCLFLCRWMTKKHAYLFQELSALQHYLDKCNNYFKTEIVVKLQAENNATPLDSAQYQVVSKMILKN